MSPFERISVHRLRVPLTVPYRLAFGPVEAFDTIVVEVVDREGRTGFGEATILTGYTDETIDDSWNKAKAFALDLPLAGAAIDARIADLGKTHPFTATAFGTALEMLARSPLLQISAETSVPLVGLLNAKHEEPMHAEAAKLLAAGYRTFKVKVGFDADEDAAMVKTVQRVVAGRAAIRLDANQGYTKDQGLRFVKALDPAGIELFEQPCAAGDWESHMAVAKAAQVPMMLDESIYGLADVETAARLGAAAYIKLKLMKMVTLEALAAALDRIRELGMKPVLGNGVAADPGCWMEACIAARRIDNAGEMNGFLKARGALLAGGLEFRDGALRLHAGAWPQLDPAALAAFGIDALTIGGEAPRRAVHH